MIRVPENKEVAGSNPPGSKASFVALSSQCFPKQVKNSKSCYQIDLLLAGKTETGMILTPPPLTNEYHNKHF